MLAGLSVDRTHDFHIFSPPLSQQGYRAALPTKIQRSADRSQDPTKIQKSVDLQAKIFSLALSKQRYRGMWMEHKTFISSVSPLKIKYRDNDIVDRTHDPLPTKIRCNTEATTLWI